MAVRRAVTRDHIRGKAQTVAEIGVTRSATAPVLMIEKQRRHSIQDPSTYSNVSGRYYAVDMNRPISIPQPQWTDSQLAEAIKQSTHWRGVMLQLGFGDRSRSAGAIRIVRRRADALSLDYSHFRGKRRWSDAQLKQAVAECKSWTELVSRLGLSAGSGNVQPHIKSHTVRLGLDTTHLNRVSYTGKQPDEAQAQHSALRSDLKNLRVAAETIAAAWFALRGCVVSLPIDSAPYDLLIGKVNEISRVQVKTTTYASHEGWVVTVGHHPDTHSKKSQRLLAYDPDEIDLFFVVDGDMTMYLIPSRAVAGRVRVLLRTYRKYIVGNASGLLEAAGGATGAPMALA